MKYLYKSPMLGKIKEAKRGHHNRTNLIDSQSEEV